MISVCVFEDQATYDLDPLTTIRPSYDLLIGQDRIIDKIIRYFGGVNLSLHCRDYLKQQVKITHPDTTVNHINMGAPCLFINGRVWMTGALARKLNNLDPGHDHMLTSNGQVVALYLRENGLADMIASLKKIPSGADLIQQFRALAVTKEIDDVVMFSYPWDLVTHNREVLQDDFSIRNKRGIVKGKVQPFAVIYNENSVYVDHDTLIEDFVVLDASLGPIYIESGVHIQAHTRIEGPAYIGRHTQILGGRISGSTIGA